VTRTIAPEISDQISACGACSASPPADTANVYSPRLLARIFAGVGLATVVYAVVLVIIAFESAIIEF